MEEVVLNQENMTMMIIIVSAIIFLVFRIFREQEKEAKEQELQDRMLLQKLSLDLPPGVVLFSEEETAEIR